jgi:lipopolysaccharide export system protein LptC
MNNMNLNTGDNQADLAFFRGNQLTPEQFQDRVDAGLGHTVHTSSYGYHYDKMFVGGQHQLNLDAAALSEGNGTQSTTRSSHSEEDSGTSLEREILLPAVDLELAPAVKKLEEQAGQLETAADNLKAEHDNAAVDAFEVAAGKVARAAEEVRENPTDESAIEEFETATDELKNSAHALEGEIGDKQYQKIASAVDKFEKATDHLLAADDGEADMAGAMSKASNALESLVEATTGMAPVTDDVKASDTHALNELSEQLLSLVNDLMDKFGVDELADFEAAVEQLEEAVDTFNADPTSEASIEGLEKAADGLKQATAGLKGKTDDSNYEAVSTAANAFEDAVDQLAGLDGQQAEVDKVASDMVQTLKDVVKAVKSAIEDGNTVVPPSINDADIDTSRGLNQLSEQLLSLVNDLIDKLGAKDVSAYEAAAEQFEEAIDTFVADPDSESSIEGFEKAADGLKQAMAGLEDKLGDESTSQALSKAVTGLEAAVDKLAGLDGQPTKVADVTVDIASSLEALVNAVKDAVKQAGGSNTVGNIEEPHEEPASAAREPNDVSVNIDDLPGQPFPGNTGVVTPPIDIDSDIFYPLPIPPVSPPGADRVEAMADKLKHSAIDIAGNLNMPELNQFEAAVDRLEAAADTLAMTPKDEGAVNEFKAAANALQDVTHALDGKIQGGAYEKAASAVDDLVDAAERLRTAENGTKIRINNDPALNDAATAISQLDNVVNFDLKSDSEPPFFDDGIRYAQAIKEPNGFFPDYKLPPVSPPGTDRVEAMADQLKHSAIDIAGNLNMPELNQFEAAVDRLEAAADTLAMTPKDEEAVNEFKAAANELQEVTHALDGKIQGSAYEKAASAVDDLANAAERLRTAENGTKIRINNDPALNDAATAISKLDNVVNFDLKSDSEPPFFDKVIPFSQPIDDAILSGEPEPAAVNVNKEV